MFGISFWEIIVIFLVALVVLGPERLSQLARIFGKLVRRLQKVWTYHDDANQQTKSSDEEKK